MEAINKEILIEGVDPRELYGAQDIYLELMRELSPKVKIVARGSSLKALGAKRDVDAFERKMNALVEYYIKYGHISREVVEQAFSAGLSDCVEPKADKDTIVFVQPHGLQHTRFPCPSDFLDLAQTHVH